MNGLDLFSGIGGIALALDPWVRVRAYCEVDRYCQAVLLSQMSVGRLSMAPIWDDVRTLHAGLLPAVDIITGGFPCQDISIAGAGAGLAGERSGLFFEIIRLTRGLRPRFVFLENVPAITIRGLERVCLEFTALGYDSRWTTLSAGELGAPHLRERWWFLAHASGERLQEPRTVETAPKTYRRAPRDSAIGGVQASFWQTPARDVCGMDDGISPKTHRIRALGNAVVPIQARKAFMRLMGLKTPPTDTKSQAEEGGA